MSKGSWNHAVCGECWIFHSLKHTENCLYDDQHIIGVLLPIRLKDTEPELCCYCGGVTKLGAYLRADPKLPELKCANALC